MTFNEEAIPKLKEAIAVLEDMPNGLKKGMVNVTEICEETGSSELMKSQKGAEEAVDALCKSGEELKECFEQLLNKYTGVSSALGGM